jgi:hypothetical protein
MKITIDPTALPETFEISDSSHETVAALKRILKSGEKLVSVREKILYDFGVEGYWDEPNGKPVRKISFYIEEF